MDPKSSGSQGAGLPDAAHHAAEASEAPVQKDADKATAPIEPDQAASVTEVGYAGPPASGQE
ncbi:MAG: hypothetical protein JWP97_4449 [Labilithrix sp.]|nr:hypothetical protein [Labilithrix sp.]